MEQIIKDLKDLGYTEDKAIDLYLFYVKNDSVEKLKQNTPG